MTMSFGPRLSVLDDSERVVTPVGMPCLWCGEPIEPGDRGSLVTIVRQDRIATVEPRHTVCELPSRLGTNVLMALDELRRAAPRV